MAAPAPQMLTANRLRDGDGALLESTARGSKR